MLSKARMLAAVSGAGLLIGGCATMPANKLPFADVNGDVMRQVMAQEDKIVLLSDREPSSGKPDLLLLHGVTDDPTEMMDIARQWHNDYDIFLYSFNPHDRAERVGDRLVIETKRLQARNRLARNATVIVYSYSAIVFRAAVIGADEPSIFSSMSLIQLVPTAGGSRLARWMALPLIGQLAALASKPSDAENPYGRLSKKLWDGAGNKKFYDTIPAERMRTILVEGDTHCVAGMWDKKIQRRYKNGIGPNVVVIPKTTGVTHEYFPTHPVALTYLHAALASLGHPALAGRLAEMDAAAVAGFRPPDQATAVENSD